MVNKFKKIALGAALMSASAASFAAMPFTIDNTQGYDDTTGVGSTFVSTKITGRYNEVIVLNDFAAGQFSATIVLQHDSFGIFPNTSGLTTDYGLYSIINIEGNVTNNSLPTSISTGNWTGNYNMVLDVETDTNTVAANRITGINTFGFSAAELDDDVELFSGTIQSGGSLGDDTRGGFSLSSSTLELSAAGENFFIKPNPFWSMLISDGDLEDFFSQVLFTEDAVGDIQRFDGEASVEFVPEPSLIALFGLGLIGLGVRARKS